MKCPRCKSEMIEKSKNNFKAEYECPKDGYVIMMEGNTK